MDHRKVIGLIIAWTLLLVFVFTAIITSLSLLGWVLIIDQNQQAKLFYVLIVEVVVIAVAYLKGFLMPQHTIKQNKSTKDDILKIKDFIHTKSAIPTELFLPRKELLKDWLEIIKNSEEVIIVNGISRKDLWDPPTLARLNESIKSVKNFTVVWDSKYNQAIRFFQIKEWDKTYKGVNLSSHLSEKAENTIRKLARISQETPSFTVKMLPFPVSYTFLKFDKGIYVTFLGAVRGSNCPCLFLGKGVSPWYEHFDNFVNHILNVSCDIEYDFNTDTIKTSEFLQIVNERGELLTALPRNYIETINEEDNSVQRKNLGHRHIYCFVLSKSGKLLLQKRAKGKDNEYLWDKSVGGHVQFDETVVTACIREVAEELGINYNNEKHLLSVLKRQIEPIELRRTVIKKGAPVNLVEYSSYYLFLFENVDEDEITPNPDEIQDIKWLSPSDAITFIKTNESEVTPDLIDLSPDIEKLTSACTRTLINSRL